MKEQNVQLPEDFLKLLGVTVEITEAGPRLNMHNHQGFYPCVKQIPLLINTPGSYLHNLCSGLEHILYRLRPRLDDVGDRFWAQPQYEYLQCRLRTVRKALLHFDDLFASSPQPNGKYNTELMTDIYTRVSWGHLSKLLQTSDKRFMDAGNMYASIASKISQYLPNDGLFLDIGCSVGRIVFEAAKIAENGLAIGIDLSFNEVARAWQIVKGTNPIVYPIREEIGLTLAQIAGHNMHNAILAVGDGMDILLPDQSMDCITACFVLEVVPAPRKLLSEVVRLLKPGGVCIIIDPLNMVYNYDFPSSHRMAFADLEAWIAQNFPGEILEVDQSVVYQARWNYSRVVEYKPHMVSIIKAKR